MARKIAEYIGKAMLVAGSGWILMSWFDVVCHNTTDYIYAAWNIFTLVF